jgi:hypothetical protein
MAAIDKAMQTKILNALTPTGAAGIPGTMITALGGAAMKLKLTSTQSTSTTSGTEIASGNGYTTGGQAFSVASTASSAGSAVTCPKTTALSWTNGAGGWTIYSMELTDSAGLRVWFADFNGAPITVAAGNTFTIAADAISITVT